MLRLSRISVSKNHLMAVTSRQAEKARKLTHTFVIAVIFCLPELLCFLVSFLDRKLPQKGRLTLFHFLSLAWGKIKWAYSLSPFLFLPLSLCFKSFFLPFPPFLPSLILSHSFFPSCHSSQCWRFNQEYHTYYPSEIYYPIPSIDISWIEFSILFFKALGSLASWTWKSLGTFNTCALGIRQWSIFWSLMAWC